jgi:hypothetical protein
LLEASGVRFLAAAASGIFAVTVTAWEAQWASIPFTLAVLAYVLSRS